MNPDVALLTRTACPHGWFSLKNIMGRDAGEGRQSVYAQQPRNEVISRDEGELLSPVTRRTSTQSPEGLD